MESVRSGLMFIMFYPEWGLSGSIEFPLQTAGLISSAAWESKLRESASPSQSANLTYSEFHLFKLRHIWKKSGQTCQNIESLLITEETKHDAEGKITQAAQQPVLMQVYASQNVKYINLLTFISDFYVIHQLTRPGHRRQWANEKISFSGMWQSGWASSLQFAAGLKVEQFPAAQSFMIDLIILQTYIQCFLMLWYRIHTLIFGQVWSLLLCLNPSDLKTFSFLLLQRKFHLLLGSSHKCSLLHAGL